MTKREIERHGTGLKRYVIRIYKLKYCFENYNDYIYYAPEIDVVLDDILVERTSNTIQGIAGCWKRLLKKYEGYTYCVKDVDTGDLLVGGVFDPNDLEIIEECMN